MPVMETLGRMLGAAVAPAALVGSAARRARLFHPDGALYRADVRALSGDALARALEGKALLRLSGSVWRWPAGMRRPDLLGIAARFHPDEARAQDVLFATFRVVPEMPIAFFTTNARDFLANTYATVLPLHAAELGRADLRLVPEPAVDGEPPAHGASRRDPDRYARLADAVRAGRAIFDLQIRERRAGAHYRSLARITLRERLEGGGEDLRFDPFRAGLGIRPVGFLQAVRAIVYPASQLGRALARAVVARARVAGV